MKPPLDHPEIRDHRFQRHMAQVAKSVRRGNDRILVKLVREIGAATMHMTTVEQIVARYAALDPEVLEALGGDRFAPRPSLRLVQDGGRRHG